MRSIKQILLRSLLTLELLNSLSGCAQTGLIPKTKVDLELVDFIEEFKLISTRKQDMDYANLSVNFTDIKSNRGVIGTCHNRIFYSTIEIDKTFWAHSSFVDKKAVVFHELMHCVCNSDHTNTPPPTSGSWLDRVIYKIASFFQVNKEHLEDGCPVSWMNSSIAPTHCSYKHYNYYVQDVKKKCEL